MVRIKQGVDYVGSFRHKKFWSAQITDDDGTPHIIAMAYFPAYMRPGAGSYKFMTRSAEMATNQAFEYVLSCRYANVPNSFNPNVDDYQPIINEFLPTTEAQVLDDDGTVADVVANTSPGITGRNTWAKQGLSAVVKNWTYEAEFPKHMYASSSDAARFFVKCSAQNEHFTPKKMVAIDQPSLLIWEAWQDDPNGYAGDADTSSNHNIIMTGNQDQDEIYQAAIDQLSSLTDPDATSDDLSAAMVGYLHHGNVDDNFNPKVTPDLEVWGWTSFPVDVYTPAKRNYYAAP